MKGNPSSGERRKSRIKIGPRIILFFIILILISGAVGLWLNLYFEEWEKARSMGVFLKGDGRLSAYRARQVRDINRHWLTVTAFGAKRTGPVLTQKGRDSAT